MEKFSSSRSGFTMGFTTPFGGPRPPSWGPRPPSLVCVALHSRFFPLFLCEFLGVHDPPFGGPRPPSLSCVALPSRPLSLIPCEWLGVHGPPLRGPRPPLLVEVRRAPLASRFFVSRPTIGGPRLPGGPRPDRARSVCFLAIRRASRPH